MNCKQGDLAFIIKATFIENMGAVVTCERWFLDEHGAIWWEVKSDGRLLAYSDWDMPDEVRCGVDDEVCCLDIDLRPIRPGDLHETEDERKEVTA